MLTINLLALLKWFSFCPLKSHRFYFTLRTTHYIVSIYRQHFSHGGFAA